LEGVSDLYEASRSETGGKTAEDGNGLGAVYNVQKFVEELGTREGVITDMKVCQLDN
jgi:hypothetical protein